MDYYLLEQGTEGADICVETGHEGVGAGGSGAAVQEDMHYDGCGCRQVAHPGDAADVLLPAPDGTGGEEVHVHCTAAAVQVCDRIGEGEDGEVHVLGGRIGGILEGDPGYR